MSDAIEHFKGIQVYTQSYIFPHVRNWALPGRPSPIPGIQNLDGRRVTGALKG